MPATDKQLRFLRDHFREDSKQSHYLAAIRLEDHIRELLETEEPEVTH